MVYHIVRMVIYIVSIFMAMIGLSCFHFENYIKKGKVREFYVFYIMASVGLGYLFASFILNFVSASFYA